MKSFFLILIMAVLPLSLFAQEQLCSKVDTLVASDDGSLFLRLEGIKRSFYTQKGSSFISVITLAKSHEMKICLEGFGEFEESKNRQSFHLIRIQ